MHDWLYRDVPVLSQRVHRIGIAGNFGVQPKTFQAALDAGVNYVFWTPKMRKVTPVLKDALKRNRQSIILATGPTFAYFGGTLERSTEKILKLLDIDYIDILQQFWMGKTSAQTDSTMEALHRLRGSGKVRFIGTSIHDRERAGHLAKDKVFDMLMVRYNAAHPGAEVDIFPHVNPSQTAIVSYTATRWRKLLKRPRGWKGTVPSAADCYRFCLSRSEVDLCLMGVRSEKELRANLDGLSAGPMMGDEMDHMRAFGQAVRG